MRLNAVGLRKPAIVLAAVVAASALTLLGDGRTGLSLVVPASMAESGSEAGGLSDDYRAARLPVLNRVIMEVHERYIEPDRIDQRAMLLSGLDFIQRSVAEILVRHDEGSDEVTVRVDTAERTFPLTDLDRPWALSFRFREIFRFIQANLRSEDTSLSDIEYAAANGLLHTLDPHSVLLVPEVYEEMRLGTRGEFGGLGIVISIRDGQLTIVAPIDGTPAARAGLRRMDRIVMIGEETTINMTLDEAVDRLRGRPGTKVTIWVQRREWTEPRPFEITRDIIRIESIDSRLLPGNVGYVQIRNFQGNTYDDLREHLARLHEQGMRSLILDLRDDPGGLLDQAVRVADAFLSEGVIVTTAGNDPADREVRRATVEGTEPFYPMVVLVNSGSASASEIVAGALKGNGRALLIGERTFGKGSVQVLFDFDDGSALKLTIAHYLTPGDVSIQSVGITPDIEVAPLRVSRRNVDLVPAEEGLRESSLEAHLEATERAAERPAYTVRYYRQRRSEEEDDGGEESSDEQDLLRDFEIRLAHDLLRVAGRGGRDALLERAATLVTSRQAAEDTRLAEALRGLGVDWSSGRDQGATDLDVHIETDATGGVVQAGETLALTVRVTNRGQAPVSRLHAVARSDNPYFDDRELPFGRIAPGQTQEWTIRTRVARDAHTRSDPVRIVFSEEHGHAPDPGSVVVTVRGLPRPTFSYAMQVVDVGEGNGDGRVERGERVGLLVTVTNQGPGRTYRAQVNLKNESGEGVLLHDARFDIDDLAPGASRTHLFSAEVLPSFRGERAELELAITDFDLREEVRERLAFPLVDGDAGGPRAVSARLVSVPARAEVREWAGPGAHVIGAARAGSVYVVSAQMDGFLRVDLGEGRPGWIAEDAVGSATGEAHPDFEPRMDNTPPDIALAGEPPLEVDGDSLRLRGTVTDADRVLDMYIFVGSHKVFYLSNRDGRDHHRMSFDARLPLEAGSNSVLVVARETSDVVARRIFLVRRRGEEPPEGGSAE